MDANWLYLAIPVLLLTAWVTAHFKWQNVRVDVPLDDQPRRKKVVYLIDLLFAVVASVLIVFAVLLLNALIAQDGFSDQSPIVLYIGVGGFVGWYVLRCGLTIDFWLRKRRFEADLATARRMMDAAQGK